VIVDGRFEILHFSAGMGRYLEPTSGAASLDLLNLVHRDLRLDLRAALHRAAEHDAPVEVDGLTLGLDGARARVDIVVEPIRERPGAPASYVVVFKDGPLRPNAEEDAKTGDHHGELVQRLETELRVTRERPQATIEELETTNEELKSSNEEFQSLNE